MDISVQYNTVGYKYGIRKSRRLK